VEPNIKFFDERSRLVDLAAKNRLPAVYFGREFVDAGGLMAYGPNLADVLRRVATYVDKILKGAKPGDLPVEQPTKFKLVINLKTAKALGLEVPPLLIAQDRVSSTPSVHAPCCASSQPVVALSGKSLFVQRFAASGGTSAVTAAAGTGKDDPLGTRYRDAANDRAPCARSSDSLV
jgi:hypothetical protein